MKGPVICEKYDYIYIFLVSSSSRFARLTVCSRVACKIVYEHWIYANKLFQLEPEKSSSENEGTCNCVHTVDIHIPVKMI